MSPLLAAVLIVGLVVLAALLGLLLRRRDGRVRAVTGSGEQVRPGDLGIAGAAFGRDATLVQFSTELCARCPGVRRLLTGLADARDGVAHVDVDLTHRPDVARRFRILQTPTTLLVDSSGLVRARIAGAPARGQVETELTRLIRKEHTAHD